MGQDFHRPGDLLTLRSGPLELVLFPALGGSIVRFEHLGPQARTAILRGADGLPSDILKVASFPLVPYVNRIRGGQFGFRGREVTMQPNMTGDPSPLHGQGWLSPWQ